VEARMKKLTIRIVYGCGKVNTKTYTTRKGVDAEYARLIKGDKIYDGTRYTSDYTVTKEY
jgi:hypothetical protein